MDTRYDEMVARRRAEHGEKFDASDLAPQFRRAYNAGDSWRVKVPHMSGEDGRTQWGYVGVTTGWKPAFLLMLRRGQHGSSYLLRADTPILASRPLAPRSVRR